MTDQPAPDRPQRKRLPWIIALVAIMVIGAGILIGSRIYASSVSAQADGVPQLTSTPNSAATGGSQSPGATETPAKNAGTWVIGADSYAGYRLNEVLNGAKVTVTGRTTDVGGSLTIEDDQLTAAKLTLNVETITTDSDRRDAYFRNTAIDTSQHPEATFTLTDAVDVSPSGDGKTQSFSITGDLSINGQTKPVTAKVQGSQGDGSAQLVGQIPVTWADFGVEAPNLGFVSVEDSGFIEFSLNVTQD